MRVNLLNRLGEGKTRLEGLIGPLEREELSAQYRVALADDILHYTFRVMSLIFSLLDFFVFFSYKAKLFLCRRVCSRPKSKKGFHSMKEL